MNHYEKAASDTRPFLQAWRETSQKRWQGRRCYATNEAQVRKTWDDIRSHLFFDASAKSEIRVCDVRPHDLKGLTALWYRKGLSPATINKRLNCLAAIGVNVEGHRVREPKALKWWLNPEQEEHLLNHLVSEDKLEMRDFVVWTTSTGLRVEETLRLTRSDFSDSFGSVTVPGLKTASSQATLPISGRAQLIARKAEGWPQARPFINYSYEELHAQWQECRKFLGVEDNPTSTLKSLRRSAARRLHVEKGMPLDMVRQYLRHEDIKTTMEYLRLTGGYQTEEMRRWL